MNITPNLKYLKMILTRSSTRILLRQVFLPAVTMASVRSAGAMIANSEEFAEPQRPMAGAPITDHVMSVLTCMHRSLIMSSIYIQCVCELPCDKNRRSGLCDIIILLIHSKRKYVC